MEGSLMRAHPLAGKKTYEVLLLYKSGLTWSPLALLP